MLLLESQLERPAGQVTPEYVQALLEALFPPGYPFSRAMIPYALPHRELTLALRRLTRAGHLCAATRRVHYRPAPSPLSRPRQPGALLVARAHLYPHVVSPRGDEALELLGLRTPKSRPGPHTFISTAAQQTFLYGAQPIQIRKVPPDVLALGSGPAGLALSALYYLGRDTATRSTVRDIQRALPTQEWDVLAAHAGQTDRMPGWLRELILAEHLT
ncbi:hypothetical protein [Deinococcus soli (ex Cha et al. 2016)]|uniref:Uncharacterized protein n=2 Tax=Deinococcus soli (ex Cha et al. 2016) TaxID=1309411 RepID=A0AAE3XCZ3_9DEIO|nr:hypothetical protein [Deinococcus soli (ex Cha et al. 2016)]MDR6218776.1 hypothetical protein [Deinococcus soli (ex Cha et al. 2016)]MDR6328573.1 hypothetical protein [Deinococcus soli (ex Cha et al. 2016)]MDR6751940.1 hypothetical protein [Deinococcus soli (ex Cha et al. 2016)]